jgi:hypothetical protein
MAERSIEAKFTHEQVDYQHPAKGEDHCAECIHYIKAEPMRCEIVKAPIAGEDWCRKFKEKPGESVAYERKEQQEYGETHRR